jgi:hypothetical protein
VLLDASQLTSESIELYQVVSIPPSGILQLHLLPGLHQLLYPSSTPTTYPNGKFTVTITGEVVLEQNLAQLASWDGTTLLVTGAPVLLDASTLTSTSLEVTQVASIPPSGTLQLHLLPGMHRLHYPSGLPTTYPGMFFGILDSGQVGSFLPSWAAWDGTVFQVTGVPIVLDTSALHSNDLTLYQVSGNFPPSASMTVRLLPGLHRLLYPTAASCGGGVGCYPHVEFTALGLGGVTIEPPYNAWLAGAGTPASPLLVTGSRTRIAAGGVPVTLDGVGEFPNCMPLLLLPGHSIASVSGVSGEFVVDGDGGLSYDPSLESIWTGAGGTLLQFRDTAGVPFDCPPPFVRGDANDNQTLEVGDAISILEYLFPPGPGSSPPCIAMCDADDSDAITIQDAFLLLYYLFVGGPPPPEPFPTCKLDPTGTSLDCDAVTSCP